MSSGFISSSLPALNVSSYTKEASILISFPSDSYIIGVNISTDVSISAVGFLNPMETNEKKGTGYFFS